MGRSRSSVSRRELLAAVGLAAAACRAPRSAPADRALPAERAPRRAPTTAPLVYDEHGGLFVEASIDGRPPVRMILDTGASRSTISSGYAAELGLELRPGDAIEGSAGVVESASAVAEVAVEGLDPAPIDLAVYGFASYDPACKGILGYEVLSRAPFQLRYRDRLVVWSSPAPSDVLGMELDGRIPRIRARIGGAPVDLRIDTGAALPPGDDAYVNLTAAQASALGLSGKPHAVFTATGTGGAVLELPVHRLSALEIGSARLERAFAIVQPPVGYFARPDAVGFLGNSVLDKLDPYLDYAGGAFAPSSSTMAR